MPFTEAVTQQLRGPSQGTPPTLFEAWWEPCWSTRQRQVSFIFRFAKELGLVFCVALSFCGMQPVSRPVPLLSALPVPVAWVCAGCL